MPGERRQSIYRLIVQPIPRLPAETIPHCWEGRTTQLRELLRRSQLEAATVHQRVIQRLPVELTMQLRATVQLSQVGTPTQPATPMQRCAVARATQLRDRLLASPGATGTLPQTTTTLSVEVTAIRPA